MILPGSIFQIDICGIERKFVVVEDTFNASKFCVVPMSPRSQVNHRYDMPTKDGVFECWNYVFVSSKGLTKMCQIGVVNPGTMKCIIAGMKCVLKGGGFHLIEEMGLQLHFNFDANEASVEDMCFVELERHTVRAIAELLNM